MAKRFVEKFCRPRLALGDESNIISSYEPPKGFKPMQDYLESETFDWNTVHQNPDLEIWAIRVPRGVRASLTIQRCRYDYLPAYVG